VIVDFHTDDGSIAGVETGDHPGIKPALHNAASPSWSGTTTRSVARELIKSRGTCGNLFIRGGYE
jgi:hypothetical protein